MSALKFLPWYDWLALLWFFGLWLGYARFSGSTQQATLLQTTNRYRRYWMEQATARDPRVLDGIIVQGLSSSPSFFASTTIIIIGGLLALLGATDKASEFVREIPFAVRTSVLVFDLKVMLLASIFVYAFFRFTWSMRQYTFAALVIGSMPDPEDFAAGKFDRKHFADRAGKMLGMAAETFNGGVRAYYMSFAATAWFFSSLAFAVATAAVVLILYSREFRSEVLHVLRD
ncbi:DUF599 domain-containing protein [Pseudorhodoferax soli]|uniref:Putative membrane protein n=1 Tax=Pseudorhodoferax soli TaxID=545864 RepID=A0A368XVH8_9BURK|nr:DUF599 domain-containing protein [Pseudorhodoferax soli]RCW70527.1 putative membrane protein [Pseudorhodoferax soli]